MPLCLPHPQIPFHLHQSTSTNMKTEDWWFSGIRLMCVTSLPFTICCTHSSQRQEDYDHPSHHRCCDPHLLSLLLFSWCESSLIPTSQAYILTDFLFHILSQQKYSHLFSSLNCFNFPLIVSYGVTKSYRTVYIQFFLLQWKTCSCESPQNSTTCLEHTHLIVLVTSCSSSGVSFAENL